jgi:hypothetical protein
LEKPDGGTRPICKNEPLFKMASYVKLQSVRPQADEHFGDLQLGAGKKGGAETAVHAIQAALNAGGEGTCALAIDFTNAFNSIDRKLMMEELFRCDRFEPIWRLAHWLYGQSNTLYLIDKDGKVVEKIAAEQGVLQGDALSALLFALGIHPLYNIVKQEFHGEGLQCFSILDDITFVGKHDVVLRAFAKMEELSSRITNLTIKKPKCQFLWPEKNGALPAEIADRLQVLGVKHKDGNDEPLRSIKIIGCPIGAGAEWHKHCAAALHESLDDLAVFFRRLLHPHMPLQDFMLILRLCGIPCFNFLSRVLPPSPALLDQWRLIDDRFTAILKDKLKCTTEKFDEALKQIRLPIKLSGLGMRSLHSATHAGYLSSLSQSSPLINSTIFPDRTDAPSPGWPTQLQQQHEAVKLCHSFLIENKVNTASSSLLPPTPAEVWDHFGINGAGKGTQRQLMQRVDKTLFKALEQSFTNSPTDLSRIASLCRPGSGYFLSVLPTEPALALNDVQMRHAIMMRLGLPPRPDMPSHCKCGKSLAHVPYHFNSCATFRRRSTLDRHNHLCQNIADFANRAQVNVVKEPRVDKWQDCDHNLYADLSFSLPESIVYADTSVTDPTAASYHTNHRGKAAECREKAKKSKYTQQVERPNGHASFVPIVFETFGFVGNLAKPFFKTLAQQYDNNGLSTSNEHLNHLRRVLSITLQRGNAAVSDEGIKDSRAPHYLAHRGEA